MPAEVHPRVILATYRPLYGDAEGRIPGRDEDALTMAVQAGRTALDAVGHGSELADRVVLVGDHLPLLPGGEAAVLLAALGLPPTTQVVERAGGPTDAVDAVAEAGPNTLVLASHASRPAGAAAALVLDEAAVELEARYHRSLPVRTWAGDGTVLSDDDPRFVRARGFEAVLAEIDLDGDPIVAVGVDPRTAKKLCGRTPPVIQVGGAAAGLFGLAAAFESNERGSVLVAQDATIVVARVESDAATVLHDELPVEPVPAQRVAPGPAIPFVASAYDRAFDAKLGWKAGSCDKCGTLAMPPRHRCLTCGAEGASSLVPLPRSGSVYTTTTIHVTVPGLASPYSVAVVELDDTDVRVLVSVTGAPPGSVDIGDVGSLVLRKVADRSGVPDYGYAFCPAEVVR